MTSSYLKPFMINGTDIDFITAQVNFRPLFDVDGNAIIAWDGTGPIYDGYGKQIWDGTGLSAAQAQTPRPEREETTVAASVERAGGRRSGRGACDKDDEELSEKASSASRAPPFGAGTPAVLPSARDRASAAFVAEESAEAAARRSNGDDDDGEAFAAAALAARAKSAAAACAAARSAAAFPAANAVLETLVGLRARAETRDS